MIVGIGGLRYSAVTPLPCLALLGHLTADKGLVFNPPNSTSWASFIRRRLSEMAGNKR